MTPPAARPALLAVLCLLLAAPLGCRTVLPSATPPLARDDPRPAALVAGLGALAAERSSLRASARVSIEGQRGASFARQLVLLERPSRLRLEVLGVLGQRVAVLASDGAHYDLYRAEKPGLESGEVHPGILYEVAGLAITPEEVIQLALGAPLAPGASAPGIAGAAELPEGGVRVELGYRAGELRRVVEFDAGGALVRYAARDAEGGLVLEARFTDYRDVAGSRFAFHIEVSLPAAESRAEIQFQSVELNPALPAELFRLPQRIPAAGAPWRRSAS
ncbi:MAG TPA: hypothetical protein VNE71_14550 [Myxococcota bacterium]|nr:hypothetical protein [Myxococcota bacterium]